jgi:CBS domain containing-hemolysin-like protein
VLLNNPTLLTDTSQIFDVKAVMRQTLYIPMTVSVDKLLEQMQKTKIHLAIAIDEFGGMAGVVTMEDIMEELIGEVQDEFDTETNPIVEAGGKTLLDGLVSMSEVEERYGKLEEESESATVGGYILEQLGRMATVGDSVPYGSYLFNVREMDGMRVTQIEVTKTTSDNEATAKE